MDNIILLSKPQDQTQMIQFKEALMQTYAMREIGDVQWFLGIQILRDRDQQRLWLSQDSYIDKIVKQFGLETHKMPDTRMTEPLQKNEGIATSTTDPRIPAESWLLTVCGNHNTTRYCPDCSQAIQICSESIKTIY